MPVKRKVGDKVIGGTINKNGNIQIRTLKIGKDTMLAQIIQTVEQAMSSKAPIARIADKVAGYFVPIVIGIALLVFGYGKEKVLNFVSRFLFVY